MQFTKTVLPDVYKIDLERRGDDRGFFARLFCKKEFELYGLETQFVQANNSFSQQKGTLRGLHYQLPPNQEAKIVRCMRGAIFDVVVDLRPKSPTFLKWFGTELTEDNRRMLFIPKGCAHGFLTLSPDTELFYLVSAFYAPEQERTLRWNDPEIGIQWPFQPQNLSEKDQNASDFTLSHHLPHSLMTAGSN